MHGSRYTGPILGIALLLSASGCGSDASEPTPDPAAAATEDTDEQASPTNPCRDIGAVREALGLGTERLERTENELTGEPPAELLVWYGEADRPGEGEVLAAGAKRARLFVVDCAGDAPRTLGERSFRYIEDSGTTLLSASDPGLRMRPVSFGERTLLRVDVTSVGARDFSERVALLEVHEGALREVFACETAREERGGEGVTSVRREVQLVADADPPGLHVRQQRDEGPVEEADYAWAEGSFEPAGDDLCRTE